MLPLIVRPALLEMLGAAPGSPAFNTWVGFLFYVPALAGGAFGLLGGYLTGLFGRRRSCPSRRSRRCPTEAAQRRITSAGSPKR
jgi:MFS family permease